jgi:hypothetical protein
MERIRERVRQFANELADQEAEFGSRSDCLRLVAEQARLLHATAVAKQRMESHPFVDFLWDEDSQQNRELVDEGKRLTQLMEVEELSDGID